MGKKKADPSPDDLRLAKQAALAPLAAVLTQQSVDDQLSALRAVLPSLEGDEAIWANNLIIVLRHCGVSLVQMMAGLDQPLIAADAP